MRFSETLLLLSTLASKSSAVALQRFHLNILPQTHGRLSPFVVHRAFSLLEITEEKKSSSLRERDAYRPVNDRALLSCEILKRSA